MRGFHLYVYIFWNCPILEREFDDYCQYVKVQQLIMLRFGMDFQETVVKASQWIIG